MPEYFVNLLMNHWRNAKCLMLMHSEISKMLFEDELTLSQVGTFHCQASRGFQKPNAVNRSLVRAFYVLLCQFYSCN